MIGSRDLIAFLHVPKTGGSTIIHHLARQMPGRYCNLDCELGQKVPDQDTVFVQGHRLDCSFHVKYPGRKVRYMTVLRDPAAWLVSIYHHDISRRKINASFENWYEGGANSIYPLEARRNRLYEWCRRFWLQNQGQMPEIKDFISRCWLATTTDYLDADFDWLCEGLGIANDWQRKRAAGEYDEIDGKLIRKVYSLTDAMRARIYQENPLDLELYLFARSKRKIRTCYEIDQAVV